MMIDHRQLSRDSLFLLAGLRLAGLDGEHRVKVRNLSSAGMMGESPIRVVRGDVVSIDLRNIGWVEGTIAWVQASRFGVAFKREIDPRLARDPVTDGEHTPRYLRPPLRAAEPVALFRKA